MPEYLNLLELAEDFYDAFHKLPEDNPKGISWPRYFLLCHTIELALKAFLSPRMSDKELKSSKIRHNIDLLMREAMAKGLNIGDLTAREIVLLNEAHSEYWNRYPQKVCKPVFVIDQFEAHVVELLKAVSGSIRGPEVSPPYVRY